MDDALDDKPLIDSDFRLATPFLYQSKIVLASNNSSSTLFRHCYDDDEDEDEDDGVSAYSNSWTGSSFISNESLINNESGLWMSDQYGVYDNSVDSSLRQSEELSVEEIMEMTSNHSSHATSQS